MYIYTYTYMSLSLSLYLCIYVYIYIYTYVERERERDHIIVYYMIHTGPPQRGAREAARLQYYRSHDVISHDITLSYITLY